MTEQLDLLKNGKHPELWTPRCSPDGAGFSPDRRYRYWLSRRVANPDVILTVTILWIMLNPSVADETVLDPTLRRCMDFTRRLGGTRMLVGNLFGLVSTDPRGLVAAGDPVGPLNDRNLAAMIAGSSCVVVGWGAHPLAEVRACKLVERHETEPFQCLGVNSNGSPKHPLYLRRDADLRPWPTEAAA